MYIAATPMLDECDKVSTPPAQEAARDITAEDVTCDPPNYTVPDHLLDLMAADDEKKHLAAVKLLGEKRKITRAESYLRKKFRYPPRRIRADGRTGENIVAACRSY